MQLSTNKSLSEAITLISQMSLNEIEYIKNEIVKRELYFKKFKKDSIENIVNDFRDRGYSNDFLQDLENGLKKSSVYNEN